jgi:hypothetical protein
MFFTWGLIWDWIRFEAWLLCVRERRPMESICLRSITQIKKENKKSRVSIVPDSSRVASPLQLSNVTITIHTNGWRECKWILVLGTLFLYYDTP